MRNISFSMTKASFLDGSKTVTRRTGWKDLKPGDKLMAVEKSQGLKRGEKIVQLGPLEVVSVRREPLKAIEDEILGTVAEGFWRLSAVQFVEHFCKAMKCKPETEVTRIEFRRTIA